MFIDRAVIDVAAGTGGSGADAFRREMGEWLKTDRVQLREDRVDGLEQAPAAFIGMLQGRNFGKLVVRVSDD